MPEDTKQKEKEEIMVKPVEDEQDMMYDPFGDMGDILDNFVNENDNVE